MTCRTISRPAAAAGAAALAVLAACAAPGSYEGARIVRDAERQQQRDIDTALAEGSAGFDAAELEALE